MIANSLPGFKFRHGAVRTLLIAALCLCAPFMHAAPLDPVEILTTSEGLRYGVWPQLPAKPAPTVFVLSGSIEECLGSSYFRQSTNFMAKDGIVCVTVDLPCHGKEIRPGEKSGLAGWRQRVDAGEDVMADVTGRLSKVLDHLIKTGVTDPKKIAAIGTSRGGFTACHFAAADERVKTVMAFAPLTDPAKLREFEGAKKTDLLTSLNLSTRANAMAGKALWVVIGDRDTRVDTASVTDFAFKVTAASLAKELPALVDLHVIAEPRGHTLPAGYAEFGVAWLRKNLDLAPQP